MMASRTRSRNPFRRILWLAVAMLVALLAYTGMWFYLAHRLEQRATATIAALNGGGRRVFCEEPDARGYPFRIGLFCRSVFYENAGRGVSVRAGSLRSAAQVYRPFRVIGELDGPAAIILPVGPAMEARWENLRASARLAKSVPESFSAEASRVQLSYREGDGAPLATADAVQLHARPQQPDLETAATFRGLSLAEKLAPGLPPLEGKVRLTVDDGLAVLAGGLPDLRGKSATIHDLEIGVAGGKAGLALSGPVTVGADGLIDAEFSIKVDDPAAVGRFLAAAFPEAREEIMTAAAALGGLGHAPLRLRIIRGRVFGGFVPLGRIPPI